MPTDPEQKRAIEEIKLRAPVEELVRERVPELKRRGRLWEACCPFHEERTPSFKVDPARGTWRCYGACQKGGDVLSFVQESQNLGFGEALELLAARTGVELPRRRGRAEPADDDPGLAALADADHFFQRALTGPEGRPAREYLRARGLSPDSAKAFGLGWAPRAGGALVAEALRGARGGDALDVWERAGLLRRPADDRDGRPYGFFRGRLTIPIRDLKGRTVGFGARRLEDGERAGPKYVNTPETPWFHKGRLIYALDRALDSVRREGHLVLVEGYTDVMAAHQVGVPHVAAVLGTATTEQHAALVRRAGTRRVTLVFDGDEAGRRAAWRALEGLLPLEVELAVATLPAGTDPADLCLGRGREAFLATLEGAQEWFDFAVGGLEGLAGRVLAAEVDRVLELVDRVSKPVYRESLLATLAQRLALSPSAVQQAWQALPQRRRAAALAEREGEPRGPRPQSKKRVNPVVREAYRAAAGAVLADPGLVPRIRPWIGHCPDEELSTILSTVAELFEDEDAELDPSSVMNALGEHPARAAVVPLVDHARAADVAPRELLEQSLGRLEALAHEKRRRLLEQRIASLQPASQAGDPAATHEMEALCAELSELHKRNPSAGSAA